MVVKISFLQRENNMHLDSNSYAQAQRTLQNSYKPTIGSPEATCFNDNSTEKGRQKATPTPVPVIRFSKIITA